MKITIEFDEDTIREYTTAEGIANGVKQGMSLTIDTMHPDFEERMLLTIWEEDVLNKSKLPVGWRSGTFKTRRAYQDGTKRKDGFKRKD